MKSRRSFLHTAVAAGFTAPLLLRNSLHAQNAPGKRLQIAQIGCGRMGLDDMNGVLRVPQARVVAVCDLDSRRLENGRKIAEEFYRKQGETKVDIQAVADYRQLLADPRIDAVVISTPDHWHGLMAIEAALAGKHLYVQKPLTYDVAEAIALRKAVRERKIILQTGSQQRSQNPFHAFRAASEAVRNGRIGKIKTIQIGIGIDKPSGKRPAEMPVPPNLDFERWLGPAPQQAYMEGRVHPQNSFNGRPGWITTEDFGLGMITNWGAHHIDIAQWALGQELGGPSRIAAKATFMQDDVWTVHHKYHVEMSYPDDVTVILDDSFENGLRFEGEEGWIFCARGAVRVTASDGNAAGPAKALQASDESLIANPQSFAHRWPSSRDHYENWVEAVIANRDPIAPVDQAAATMNACAAAWIGMKLGRPVTWDPKNENFGDDAEANALTARTPRSEEYDYRSALRKAGL